MNPRRKPFAPAFAGIVESLESRVVLSTIAPAADGHRGAVEVAAQTLKKAATETSLAAHAGTLGQPITFTVTVRVAASAGSPAGTVNLVNHGDLIQTLTLSPAASTAQSATSRATYTLTPQPGGAAYFFGKHAVTAQFIPGGSFAKSVASKTFTVAEPGYTSLADGVKVATIAPGSGPQVQAGQTANVMYTGYLTKTGQIFDDSINDGGGTFGFSVGAGQVVPGFDGGTAGMQVGETRIISMPAAEGYGSTANGMIPANSPLIFVVTLESIS